MFLLHRIPSASLIFVIISSIQFLLLFSFFPNKAMKILNISNIICMNLYSFSITFSTNSSWDNSLASQGEIIPKRKLLKSSNISRNISLILERTRNVSSSSYQCVTQLCRELACRCSCVSCQKSPAIHQP